MHLGRYQWYRIKIFPAKIDNIQGILNFKDENSDDDRTVENLGTFSYKLISNKPSDSEKLFTNIFHNFIDFLEKTACKKNWKS